MLITLATKMRESLIIFCTFSLLFMSSIYYLCISLNLSKLLDIRGFALPVIVHFDEIGRPFYEILSVPGCSDFVFYTNFFSRIFLIFFWVLHDICVKMSVSLTSFIRFCSIIDSHEKCDFVPILATFWCRVCTIDFSSIPSLCCSSYLRRLVCILLEMMDSDRVLAL